MHSQQFLIAASYRVPRNYPDAQPVLFQSLFDKVHNRARPLWSRDIIRPFLEAELACSWGSRPDGWKDSWTSSAVSRTQPTFLKSRPWAGKRFEYGIIVPPGRAARLAAIIKNQVTA